MVGVVTAECLLEKLDRLNMSPLKTCPLIGAGRAGILFSYGASASPQAHLTGSLEVSCEKNGSSIIYAQTDAC